MISATIRAHSIGPAEVPIATLELNMPRFLLAQFNTHRIFSRNAASSRAIPVQKMIDKVRADPFTPRKWGTAQKGMVAGAELSEEARIRALDAWESARDAALFHADRLCRLNVAKEVVNRLLEPFSWVKVLVTATDWDNFFNLRLSHDAQPEMQELAQCMRNALQCSSPRRLKYGEWHLPFGDHVPNPASDDEALLVCAARCARISYETHDGHFSVLADLALADRLLEDGHLSPFEHCASATSLRDVYHANLRGWVSFRTWLQRKGLV